MNNDVKEAMIIMTGQGFKNVEENKTDKDTAYIVASYESSMCGVVWGSFLAVDVNSGYPVPFLKASSKESVIKLTNALERSRELQPLNL